MTFAKGCFRDLPFDLEKGLNKPPIEVARKAKEYTLINALPLLSIVLSVIGLGIVIL